MALRPFLGVRKSSCAPDEPADEGSPWLLGNYLGCGQQPGFQEDGAGSGLGTEVEGVDLVKGAAGFLGCGAGELGLAGGADRDLLLAPGKHGRGLFVAISAGAVGQASGLLELAPVGAFVCSL